MSDLVIDASVLVFMLTNRTDTAADLASRLDESSCHAPYLVDAEVGQTLRRQERYGEIEPRRALNALHQLEDLIDERYAHTGAIAELAWRQRDRLSFYDSLYVSLATMLEAPLLTMDARLSRCHDLPCEVELITDN